MDNARVKKVLNRGGLGLVIVGVVAYLIGGGEAGEIADIVGKVTTIGGGAIILIRELLN